MIRARDLVKHFKVHKRPPGFMSAMKSLVRRKYDVVKAVDGVSFTIERGERVGFLGPNGAGKTTTLKVLAGLLHPTSGEVEVEGHTPYRRQTALLEKITLVMGQKSQLIWDLPPAETYAMNRAIFDVPKAEFDKTLAELTELLELAPLLEKPTRQLSLGERMKCELAAALLHGPTTLFLDEPTIGLDVAMQLAIRDFVRSYNQRHEATVLLTSHYMDDVVALCPRIIVIDRGTLIHDGDLRGLIKTMDPDKRVSFTLTAPITDETELGKLGTILVRDGQRTTLRVPERELAPVVSHLLGSMKAVDLAIEDPPLEEILRVMFGAAKARQGEPADAATGELVNRTLRAIPTLLRVGVAETVAYRAEFLVWILTTTLPLVMLGLWTSVADEAPFGQYHSEHFVAYYLAALIVRNLTGSWVAWQIAEEIRLGAMSMRLLRPLHPFVVFASSHLAAVPFRSLVALPVALVLLLSSGASALTTEPLQLAMIVPSLAMSWLITFAVLFAIGSLAFFVTKTMALLNLYFGLFSLLSGYLLPLPLLPSWIADIARYSPFRFMLSAPVELMTLALSTDQIARLMIGQLVWCVIALATAALVWRAGVRRYEAVGG